MKCISCDLMAEIPNIWQLHRQQHLFTKKAFCLLMFSGITSKCLNLSQNPNKLSGQKIPFLPMPHEQEQLWTSA